MESINILSLQDPQSTFASHKLLHAPILEKPLEFLQECIGKRISVRHSRMEQSCELNGELKAVSSTGFVLSSVNGKGEDVQSSFRWSDYNLESIRFLDEDGALRQRATDELSSLVGHFLFILSTMN